MHAEPQGREAGHECRFKAGGEISPTGRTKTAPSGPSSALAFALATCQQYEHGYFTAYRHTAQEDRDLLEAADVHALDDEPLIRTSTRAGRAGAASDRKSRTVPALSQ